MFALVSKILGRRQNRTNPARRLARARLECEALEGRQLLSVFGEFQVNTNTTLDQYQSANATAESGRSVVVWTDRYSSSDTDIRAQIYDFSGNRVGGEILVASSTRHEYAPAVAMDRAGNFVVVWTLEYHSIDTDVKAVRYTADGSRMGGEFSVVAGIRNEYDVSVGMAANGAFVVTYTVDNAGTGKDVFARMYLPSGGFTREIPVATGSGTEHKASVACAPHGAFLVAYQKEYANEDADIFVARYSAAGVLLDHRALDTSSRRDTNPQVAVDSSFNAVVVYQSFVGLDWDIKARRIAAGGGILPEFTIVATGAHETSPVVALAPANLGFVVAYVSESATSSGRVHVREVSDSDWVDAAVDLGSAWGTPSLSIGSQQNYLVTYSRRIDSLYVANTSSEVYGRFGRLGAA